MGIRSRQRITSCIGSCRSESIANLTADETLNGLKGELERCLVNYKTKRQQVEQLQQELKTTKTDLTDIQVKLTTVETSNKELLVCSSYTSILTTRTTTVLVVKAETSLNFEHLINFAIRGLFVHCACNQYILVCQTGRDEVASYILHTVFMQLLKTNTYVSSLRQL